MFLHKVENDYFDVLTKKYIHPEQLTEKSRYSLSGDSVYVLDTIRNKINEKEMYDLMEDLPKYYYYNILQLGVCLLL